MCRLSIPIHQKKKNKWRTNNKCINQDSSFSCLKSPMASSLIWAESLCSVTWPSGPLSSSPPCCSKSEPPLLSSRLRKHSPLFLSGTSMLSLYLGCLCYGSGYLPFAPAFFMLPLTPSCHSVFSISTFSSMNLLPIILTGKFFTPSQHFCPSRSPNPCVFQGSWSPAAPIRTTREVFKTPYCPRWHLESFGVVCLLTCSGIGGCWCVLKHRMARQSMQIIRLRSELQMAVTAGHRRAAMHNLSFQGRLPIGGLCAFVWNREGEPKRGVGVFLSERFSRWHVLLRGRNQPQWTHQVPGVCCGFSAFNHRSQPRWEQK